MDVLFDEREADKEVIESLLKTNGTLWRELEASRSMILSLEKQIKRSSSMAHKLLQDENGVLYIAKEVEQLAVDEVQKLYDHLKSDLALVESYLAKELNPQPAGQPAAPSDQPQNQAVDQSQAALADPNTVVAAPAAPANPAEPPADPNVPPAPAAPVLDANGNPVQAAPASDPNQVQPQPEQPVMPPLQ